jgi:transcription elongation factor GreA
MKTILTREGLKKIQDEIRFLSTSETNRLLAEVRDAKDRSGIEENTEYEAAKEQYERLQSKISKLKEMITDVTIVSKTDIDTSKVSILTSVKVLNTKTNKEMNFTIVPETDIDIKSGKISSNSPIGSALLNRVVGEEVEVVVPAGKISFKIIDITA